MGSSGLLGALPCLDPPCSCRQGGVSSADSPLAGPARAAPGTAGTRSVVIMTRECYRCYQVFPITLFSPLYTMKNIHITPPFFSVISTPYPPAELSFFCLFSGCVGGGAITPQKRGVFWGVFIGERVFPITPDNSPITGREHFASAVLGAHVDTVDHYQPFASFGSCDQLPQVLHVI